jgi:hypothetical protein
VTLAPEPLYLNHPECLVVLFDLREPAGAAELDRHCTAWPNHCHTVVLDQDHRALIVYPGWVTEPTR